MHLNRINNSCKSANRSIQRKITFVGTGDPATTPSAPIQTTTYQWNKASQITRIGLTIGTTSLTNPELVSTYSYDAAGRLASKTLPAAANTPANAQNVVQGITQTYTFDAADRLSQIKYAKSDATLIDQIDYTYDAAGQRISKTMLNGNSAPETPMTATFDAGNRMQTITLNSGKPEQKIYILSYDNNGNLTKKQLSTDTNCTTDCTEFVWDSRNRLTQIKQNLTTSASYSYDAENRRIQTNITTNGQTNQVSYIYAGSQSVGEVRNQQLSHSLMTDLQMDEHIARIALNQAGAAATPQVKTYLTDALGSVIAIAKADQSLEVGYAFSPYGQTQKVGVEGEVAGSENLSQYTGRENDNNGLYFYRARYYDPVLKRFISEDPIGLAGGWNIYAYVEGDPVSLMDPTGEIGVGGAIVGGGLNFAGQMATCMGLGGDVQTCMRCVDYLDVGLSAVGGAFGISGLSIAKRMYRNKKYGSVMGKTGRGVDANDINDLQKQFAKEKAAGWAAKKTTAPANFECEDECKKYKLMHVVSNFL